MKDNLLKRSIQANTAPEESRSSSNDPIQAGFIELKNLFEKILTTKNPTQKMRRELEDGMYKILPKLDDPEQKRAVLTWDKAIHAPTAAKHVEKQTKKVKEKITKCVEPKERDNSSEAPQKKRSQEANPDSWQKIMPENFIASFVKASGDHFAWENLKKDGFIRLWNIATRMGEIGDMLHNNATVTAQAKLQTIIDEFTEPISALAEICKTRIIPIYVARLLMNTIFVQRAIPEEIQQFLVQRFNKLVNLLD